MIKVRTVFSALTMTGVAVLFAASTPAQEKTPVGADPSGAAGVSDEEKNTTIVNADDEKQQPAPKTYPPYRRVPSNFGKVGLSVQQREDIYIIRGRYQAEITELKARIEELSRQEMEECVSVLTEAQQNLLNQIRAAARPN